MFSSAQKSRSFLSRFIVGTTLIALLCIGGIVACDSGSSDGKTKYVTAEPESEYDTSLNIMVNPQSTKVNITGPDNFTYTGVGNKVLSSLDPGRYNIDATANGFTGQSGSVDLAENESMNVVMFLEAQEVITDAPRVVYVDGDGNLIPLDTEDMQSGEFVFYAWLEDLSDGIDTSDLSTSPAPIIGEQEEVAPSFTQNLAAAWVGFVDPDGEVRPLIGADVRWEIDQWYADRLGSMQFGTSDDYGIATGLGVFDDQANTRTNNAYVANLSFPFTYDYPLFNKSGIISPDIDGFTWATLFSPDAIATGRIVAVASVNGVEIGKEVLIKHFAPQPKIEITKTVSPAAINLDNRDNVTFTVTVTNVGSGDATNVSLHDIFNEAVSTGLAADYALSDLPAGAIAGGDDDFDYTFPLAAGESEVLTFTATVTDVGRYCNDSIIDEYTGMYKTESPVDLSARACFVATESDLSIIKDFVDANNNSLGPELTVAADVSAKLRIRVINSGGAEATDVDLSDLLTSGTLANYTFSNLEGGGTPNANGGFDYTIDSISPNGGTKTFYYNVEASADGEYCDTATITPPGVSDEACLTVETAILEITKTNSPGMVLPGANYTSTITVTNVGNAVAKNVSISDLLGLNPEANMWAIYESSSLEGVSGSLASNIVTANSTIDIEPANDVTFTVVSSIPPGAVAGTYCDYGRFISDNAGNGEAEACVIVPSYVALQTELVDLEDPVSAGGDETFFSVLYNEERSNEGADGHFLTYSFGLDDPANIGTAGSFQVNSTMIYLDTNPVRDPVTGMVVSDASNSTASLLTEGVDYTLSTSLGYQEITFAPDFELKKGQAFYLYHDCTVPTSMTTGSYTTSYIWVTDGMVSGTAYESSSSEPTTVLQQ